MASLAQLTQAAVTNYGYPGLFTIMVVENVFPPIPSEIVLPLAGFEVSQGRLAFLGALLASSAGSLIGALLLYELGRRGGRPLILRHRRVLRISPDGLDRADAWFGRWGDLIVVGGRLVPGFRSLVSVPAGMGGMPLLRFSVLTAVGSSIWNAALITAGQQLGANRDSLSGFLGTASSVAVAATCALALLAGFVWWKRRGDAS